MKEDFKNEEELANLLDTYKVDVPTKKLSVKQSPFNRFIRYLGSPAKDPLADLSEGKNGYLFLKLFPIACGIFLALVQILFLF